MSIRVKNLAAMQELYEEVLGSEKSPLQAPGVTVPQHERAWIHARSRSSLIRNGIRWSLSAEIQM